MSDKFTRVNQLLQAAIESRRAKNGEAIAAAEKNLADAQGRHAQLRQTAAEAREVLERVQQARRAADSPALVLAEREANDLVKASNRELGASGNAIGTARVELANATQHLQPLNALQARLQLAVPPHRAVEQARAQLELATSALRVEAQNHVAIAQAESEVAARLKDQQTAVTRLEQAQTAHDHMKTAAERSSLASVKTAAAETERLLQTAKDELETAERNLVDARAALALAHNPISDLVELVAATEALLADEIAEERRRTEMARPVEAVVRHEQEAESVRDSRGDEDRCECSESGYRCHYCYARQNAMATGQAYIDHDDPTR